MASEPDVDGATIAAALTLARTCGWRGVTLAAIAAETGSPIAEICAKFPSRDAILVAFNRRIDAEILTDPLETDGSVRERLFEMIMRRFDALAPHRVAIRAILRGTFGDPLASLQGLCAVHASMALTLEACGVSASGPLGRMRAHALSALYLRIFYEWLRMEGDNDRIMAALDKALGRAEKFATSWAEGRLRPRATEPSDIEANTAPLAETSEQSG